MKSKRNPYGVQSPSQWWEDHFLWEIAIGSREYVTPLKAPLHELHSSLTSQASLSRSFVKLTRIVQRAHAPVECSIISQAQEVGTRWNDFFLLLKSFGGRGLLVRGVKLWQQTSYLYWSESVSHSWLKLEASRDLLVRQMSVQHSGGHSSWVLVDVLLRSCFCLILVTSFHPEPPLQAVLREPE